MRRPRNNSESQQYQDMSSRRLSINWRSPDRGETWWKPWLSVIIKLFMAWLSRPLIIRLFPLNSLPWLSRISDTSENKPERFDSDNQINISRLISFLARDLNEKKLGIWTKKKGLLYWCFTYVILYFSVQSAFSSERGLTTVTWVMVCLSQHGVFVCEVGIITTIFSLLLIQFKFLSFVQTNVIGIVLSCSFHVHHVYSTLFHWRFLGLRPTRHLHWQEIRGRVPTSWYTIVPKSLMTSNTTHQLAS